MKKIFCAFTIFLVAGCTVQRTWKAIDGSHSDATVVLAYDYGKFQRPETKEGQALEEAIIRCRNWGYQNAKGFSPIVDCIIHDYEGDCKRWRVSVKYQCTQLKKDPSPINRVFN